MKQSKIIIDIKTLFQQVKEFYKPVSVGTFWSNNYIEYEGNSDRIKTLSIKEYFDAIKPYFKNMNNLQKSYTQKIQATIAINFISSKNTDEERAIHSKREHRNRES